MSETKALLPTKRWPKKIIQLKKNVLLSHTEIQANEMRNRSETPPTASTCCGTGSSGHQLSDPCLVARQAGFAFPLGFSGEDQVTQCLIFFFKFLKN